jgi:hypothetical protein
MTFAEKPFKMGATVPKVTKELIPLPVGAWLAHVAAEAMLFTTL